tara:strand:+ start:32919 stop:34262 length:1344 start_codon:yes stop_codon:yes gene_type:complete
MRSKYKFYTSILVLVLFTAFWCTKPFTNTKSIATPKKVYSKKIEGHFQLFKNNKHFYIRGTAGEPLFKELAAMGGNTLRLYDTINLKRNLIEAEKYGISIIVDIPIPRYNDDYNPYANESNNNLLKKEVRTLVRNYKKYPALLLWNLGNEVEFPFVLIKNKFIYTFNELIDIIHDEDPDHPVSTAINSGSRRQTLSIYWHAPNLDIAAYNIFGNLKNLKSVISKISYITGRDMPYYISEWGANGPWEEANTIWKAPIEPTTTKKGEQYREIYNTYIATDPNCSGSLAFYWGQKQERTQTWFNIFDEKTRKNQTFYELRSIWKHIAVPQDSLPHIKYMLVDNKGSRDQLIFTPNDVKTAELLLTSKLDSTLQFEWEIRPEAWYYKEWDLEKNPQTIEGSTFKNSDSKIIFTIPELEGPYRIYVQVNDQNGNFAAANTPFYVLKSPYEE